MRLRAGDWAISDSRLTDSPPAEGRRATRSRGNPHRRSDGPLGEEEAQRTGDASQSLGAC